MGGRAGAWGSGKRHLGTEVVAAGFARLAAVAGEPGLDADFVAGFERGHRFPDAVYCARGFVAHGQRVLRRDFYADAAVVPEVDLLGLLLFVSLVKVWWFFQNTS